MSLRWLWVPAILMLAGGTAWFALAAPAAEPATVDIITDQDRLRVETVAQGLESPWAIAFLPGGDMLVTERPGRMRRVATDGGLSTPLSGVPEVAARGQGGLLDVVLAPDFNTTQRIYFSYSEPRGGDENATAVAHARLGADSLEDVTVIFRQQPAWDSGHHFGSRLAFAKDGTLFVTLGERNRARDLAQTLDNHIGKVVRLNPDGSVPEDNPFVGRQDAQPAVWSYGHRNPQGAAIHPQTGQLWIHEHGPRGGDEINLPQAGANYGWPVITYGREYSGLPIGDGPRKADMEQPQHYWVPSIAPSGMAFYTADRFPQWQGRLFVGSLKFGQLVRLDLDGDRVVGEHRYAQDLRRRIRDVRQGPDGFLYLLTDEANGAVLRVAPASPAS